MVIILSEKYRFPLTAAISPRVWDSAEWAMAPNDENAASQCVGFSVRKMQHMRRPVMAISVQPCWDFFLLVFIYFFFIRVYMKKLKPVFLFSVNKYISLIFCYTVHILIFNVLTNKCNH